MLQGLSKLGYAAAIAAVVSVVSPSTADACSLAMPVRADPEPSPSELRAQREAWQRDYFANLSGAARRQAAEPDRDFAGDLSRWLLPPVVPRTLIYSSSSCGEPPWEPSRRFSQIDAWDVGEAMQELHRLAGPVPRTTSADINARRAREFVALPASCDAEFRIRVADSLRTRVPQQSLAQVWQATVAHGYGESTSARGPLRFVGDRGTALTFETDGSPFGWRWQTQGDRLEMRHKRAMQRFFERDDHAEAVVSALNAIVSEVYSVPGGNERFCPTAVQSEARIVAEVRVELERVSARRLPRDQQPSS